MAIKLIGSYSKKLGLPAYSSHSFAASVETEIADLGQAQQEVARLYHLLQQAVDREIQQIGYVPGATPVDDPHGNGNGQHPESSFNSNGDPRNGSLAWTCSDRQRRLILQLVDEHEMEMNSVQEIAYRRFGTGLRQLNRQQASDLISELLGQATAGKNGRRKDHPSKPRS